MAYGADPDGPVARKSPRRVAPLSHSRETPQRTLSPSNQLLIPETDSRNPHSLPIASLPLHSPSPAGATLATAVAAIASLVVAGPPSASVEDIVHKILQFVGADIREEAADEAHGIPRTS